MHFSEKEKFFPYTIKYIREQVNIKKLEEKYCFLLHSTFHDLYNSLIDFRNNYYYSVIEQFNMENHDNNYSKILNRLNSLRKSKYWLMASYVFDRFYNFEFNVYWFIIKEDFNL